MICTLESKCTELFADAVTSTPSYSKPLPSRTTHPSLHSSQIISIQASLCLPLQQHLQSRSVNCQNCVFSTAFVPHTPPGGWAETVAVTWLYTTPNNSA